MKKLAAIILITTFAASSYAAEQAKITLNENNMSSTGGGSLEESLSVKFSRADMFNDNPISNKEKITAMAHLISYYEFLEVNKIDLSKQVTATYTQRPLVEVIKDLMPKVDVKFDGVDPKIKVESYSITKASLGNVLKHLGRASGVYLYYSKTGVLVSSKPK